MLQGPGDCAAVPHVREERLKEGTCGQGVPVTVQLSNCLALSLLRHVGVKKQFHSLLRIFIN
jgi:hypothetical protein